ncbi:MAG: PHP domain-containing protein [Candidatus Nanoarchaeia archaeon]|nr:PHP domain-containing protein [Candidatus Nanoarchaeia archaeon]
MFYKMNPKFKSYIRRFNSDKKNGYVYDMHVHTKYSRCSSMELEVLISLYKKLGFTGVAITDHGTIQGALKAKEYVEKNNIDFEIIIGAELSTQYGHILAYDIDPTLVNEVPKYHHRDIDDVVDFFKSKGCVVGIAHPYTFRVRKLNKIRDDNFIKKLDFVETFNRRNMIDYCNKLALKKAIKCNMAMTSGGDVHFYPEIGYAYTFSPIKDILKAIKEKKTFPNGFMKRDLISFARSGFTKRIPEVKRLNKEVKPEKKLEIKKSKMIKELKKNLNTEEKIKAEN